MSRKRERVGQQERWKLLDMAGQRLAGSAWAMQGWSRGWGRADILSTMSPLCTGPPRSTAPKSSAKDDGIRIFVALFDYDPVSMSPNPDAAEEELPFKEGQILKVRT